MKDEEHVLRQLKLAAILLLNNLNNFSAIIWSDNMETKFYFFSGKGGVGKTSVAAATALWLANQDYKTLLLTTDPASHLKQIFDQEVSHKPIRINGETNLWAAHIDAEKATEEYKEKILSEAAQKYDKQRLLAIEEELNSPCTEEMATFQKFLEA